MCMFIADAVGQHYAMIRSYQYYDVNDPVEEKKKKRTKAQKKTVEVLDHVADGAVALSRRRK